VAHRGRAAHGKGELVFFASLLPYYNTAVWGGEEIPSVTRPSQQRNVLGHTDGGEGKAVGSGLPSARQTNKFDNVRIIVPHMAMSAATMLVFVGNTN